VPFTAGGDQLQRHAGAGAAREPDALGEPVRTVARCREPRAGRRAVGGEGGDDRESARLERRAEDVGVPGLLSVVGEEVEDRPVVPEAVAAFRAPGEEVGLDPRDRGCPGPYPGPARLEGHRGDVEDAHVREAPLDERGRNPDGAPADVDHRGGRGDAELLDEGQRGVGLLLVPAERGELPPVDPVPVRGPLGRFPLRHHPATLPLT